MKPNSLPSAWAGLADLLTSAKKQWKRECPTAETRSQKTEAFCAPLSGTPVPSARQERGGSFLPAGERLLRPQATLQRTAAPTKA